MINLLELYVKLSVPKIDFEISMARAGVRVLIAVDDIFCSAFRWMAAKPCRSPTNNPMTIDTAIERNSSAQTFIVSAKSLIINTPAKAPATMMPSTHMHRTPDLSANRSAMPPMVKGMKNSNIPPPIKRIQTFI